MGQRFSMLGFKSVAFGDFTAGKIDPTLLFGSGGDFTIPIDYKVHSSTVIVEISTSFDQIIEALLVGINSPYASNTYLGEDVQWMSAYHMSQQQDGVYWYPSQFGLHTFNYLLTTWDSGDFVASTHDQSMKITQQSGLNIRFSAATVGLGSPTAGSMNIYVMLECETL